MTVGYAIAMDTPFALTAGAKTVILAISAANSGLLVVEFGISFDGVTASAVPALVELVSSTQAGAGTPATTPTDKVNLTSTGALAKASFGSAAAGALIVIRATRDYDAADNQDTLQLVCVLVTDT